MARQDMTTAEYRRLRKACDFTGRGPRPGQGVRFLPRLEVANYSYQSIVKDGITPPYCAFFSEDDARAIRAMREAMQSTVFDARYPARRRCTQGHNNDGADYCEDCGVYLNGEG